MKELINTYGSMLVKAILMHLYYVSVSVLIGLILGLTLGILLSRIPKLSNFIFPVLSIFQTIPGLVFIGLLFFLLGMNQLTIIIALSIYAMFPILKNTYSGILGVDKKYKEAAKGCGMSDIQSLFKVELPLALPSIISGFRMATIYTISWAVLASMIGLGGLGDFIYQGTSSNNNTLIFLGAIPAAILAIAIGALIDLISKKLSPIKSNKEAKK